MSECNSRSIFGSIEACPGKKNLPGLRRRLYYVPKADVVSFPTLTALPTGSTSGSQPTMADLGKLTGNFVLAEGKYFQHIDLKDEASNVTYETVGENGSHLFNNQANAIVAGQADEVKGFARQVVDEDIIYVYQQRDGKFAVIGNDAFVTHTAPSGDTAAEATGASTTTFAINCYDECPVPTYEGTLALSASAVLNCATGVIAAPEDDGD